MDYSVFVLVCALAGIYALVSSPQLLAVATQLYQADLLGIMVAVSVAGWLVLAASIAVIRVAFLID